MSMGGQLWTDWDSRAEVHLGSAVIRLSANTGFSFLNRDDDRFRSNLRPVRSTLPCVGRVIAKGYLSSQLLNDHRQ